MRAAPLRASTALLLVVMLVPAQVRSQSALLDSSLLEHYRNHPPSSSSKVPAWAEQLEASVPVQTIIRNAALACPCAAAATAGTSGCSCEPLQATVTRVLSVLAHNGICAIDPNHSHSSKKHAFVPPPGTFNAVGLVLRPHGWLRTRFWRHFLAPIRAALDAHGIRAPSDHVYQFGVFQGATVPELIELTNTSRFFGFDSWEGLPPHQETKLWRGGAFNIGGDRGRSIVLKKLNQLNPGVVDLINGFYDKSLTNTLAAEHGMRPARYIDIDCDLYSSTATALDWLFEHKLAVPGTLVGYDDWWALPCRSGADPVATKSGAISDPTKSGEGKAHFEITSKYGVRWQCVWGPCMPTGAAGVPLGLEDIYQNHGMAGAASPLGGGAKLRHHKCESKLAWSPIFLIEAVGSESPDPGYGITTEQQICAARAQIENCTPCRKMT